MINERFHTPRRERPWSGVGFTLMELLIVIGLLGALATLVLSSLEVTRTKALDQSIVQKEMADIQRAFQRFVADCVPSEADYRLVSRYGLEILMSYDPADSAEDPRGWSFDDEWNTARGKGWRGPYLQPEGTRKVDVTEESNGYSIQAQEPTAASGGKTIYVVETPYAEDGEEGDGEDDFYRVYPVVETEAGVDTLKQLWLVFPPRDGSSWQSLIDKESYPKRRLLLR